MTESKPTYGAIAVPEGNENEYDETNTYYLNASSFNWNKFFRAAVPIVVALVIMGGLAFGMSHGFSHFYPDPSKGDDDNNVKRDQSWTRHEYECSKNPKCAALGLTGNCCPTNAGDMLQCC